MRAITTEEKKSTDTVRERTGGRSAKVREAILQAARRILTESGADSLTHRNVAQYAGVNASTVYRRWPDRARLIADVFKNTADDMVRTSDSGDLSTDLLEFLHMIVTMLSSSEGRKLTQGAISAITQGDDVVKAVLHDFWEQRFQQAEIIFEQAAQRGEANYKEQRRIILETLVAPIWFRVLITQQPVDEGYLIENINRVLKQFV